jgi:chorismate mutase/prephenate dehydratase
LGAPSALAPPASAKPICGYLSVVAESKRQLDELRKEIARLDLQLLAGLDERARAARRLGELLQEQAPQLPLADHAAIRSLVARSTGDMPEEALRDIFRSIFAACLALELPVKVAFVGVEGDSAHMAAGGRFGQASNVFGVESTVAALDEVSRRRAEFAVVPFESSLGVDSAAATAVDVSSEGPLQSTILALLASDLRIAEMLDATFDLHLVNPTGEPSGIETVYAVAADRARCERFLASRVPALDVMDARSRRMACERAAQEPNAAAIANETFAARFGLAVAQRSILDRAGDRVRYAVAGARPSRRTGQDVTSLVFTARDAAGSLLDVLRVLAERGINLTNIQSHPVRGEAWSYLFYVELAGHVIDRPLVTAFEEIKRLTRSFKVLGSYPAP